VSAESRAARAQELADALARQPRVPLGTLPTPLVATPRLGAAIGLPGLWMKRDDLTGLAFGGNKVRQMEFFLGDARARGGDLLIAGGSVDQSNHARVAAAAARAAGMRSLIVFRPGGTHPGPQGNGLLTRMLADESIVVDALASAPTDRLAEVAYRARVFEALAAERRAAGEHPYVLLGTSIPLGALGYVAAALELLEQTTALGLDRPVVAVTSAGATQAGLEAANRLLGSPFRVVGLAYLPTDGQGAAWVATLAEGVAAHLGLPLAVDPASVVNVDHAAGPRYGALTPARRGAIALAIEHEGILLDPVYTATGLATLRAAAAAGSLDPTEPVVFIHTGGLPALFAYAAELSAGGPSGGEPGGGPGGGEPGGGPSGGEPGGGPSGGEPGGGKPAAER
jgi:1-aminocyclopropane-1-carboxylate deaminase/D-cysteine desulfhydrase-like pyridoxal-dependent ACC family enzyme